MMTRTVLIAVAVAALAACSSIKLRSPTAVANLAPTKGNQVSGAVHFTQQGELVLVEGRVTGLTPGPHGFHIPEKGNCTAPDASSAGAHFNPTGAPHAAPSAGARHAGDLGNLVADDTGTAVYRAEIRGISLGSGEDSIIGRAVIVHASRDDLTTQPAGNAGARQACGLISLSKDKWF